VSPTRLTSLAQSVGVLTAAGLSITGVQPVVEAALEEDLGGRGVLPPGVGYGADVTSMATIPAEAGNLAEIVARAPGTLAGAPVAAYVLALVCGSVADVEVRLLVEDGEQVSPGDVVLAVAGNTRALLRAERVALNLLTMMSGVATATKAWVTALEGSGMRIRDTRKTLPGMRMLQKYAVRVGGGVNHRMALSDAALVKDNHVLAAGGVVPAYLAVRERFPDIAIQVEVTSISQAREVVRAGAREVLLDNMGTDEMTSVMTELGEEATFEASGGLTLAKAALVAATGVHFVAVGAITHSAPVLDFGLDFRASPGGAG
jgi:nicotinate-nucleotide pyrophosphorylase (carboxylating)